MSPQPSITHLVCEKTSYNPNDISHRYCGFCHLFMEEGSFTLSDEQVVPPSDHFWVNGIVAVRNGEPYIQLSTEKGMITQLTMREARSIAHDILIMCSRTEADAMVHKFFSDAAFPKEAAGALMLQFRDFRMKLDQEKLDTDYSDPDTGEVKGR